jgi:hypothetical protein
MDAKNGAKDPNFKFAQSLEIGGLGERVIEELNNNWRCKKVGIDFDADHKELKNQARIEFWSFTGVKMGDITLKEDKLLNPGPLKAALKNYRAKNTTVCAKEVKRMAEMKKALEKAEQESAAK